MSLRTRQKDAILTMLHLNNKEAAALISSKTAAAAGGDEADGTPLSPLLSDPVWKVLIYDQAGQEIISPLLKVNELRENGITVHMHLNSDRLPIPDVPAIYFIQPTLENLKRIGQDMERKIYESYYLNFTFAIPRPLLEELATISISSNASNQISQVYDQYMNYICLEERLFTFNLHNSYTTLHDPTSSDSTIDSLTDRIVNSLFSVVSSLGTIPIIKSPRRSAATNIATKLEQRLRDHVMNSRNNLFADSMSSSLSQHQRPVLILLDRDFDLSTMLSHSWTYSALVHDLLDMKLNRVLVQMDDNGQKSKKSYDIDMADFFWAKNSGNPFPQVAEDVSAEINKYKKDVEEVTKSSGVSSLEDLDPTANAKNLKNAISVLPQLTERKRTLDMHMNIATALFKIIGDRQLDTFTAIEESISKQTKASLLEVFKDPKKTAEDKLRLFLIFYFAVEDISKEDMAQYEEALTENGVSLSAVGYAKSVRSFSKIVSSSSASAAGAATSSTSSDLFQSITSNISKIAGQLDSSRVGGGLENLLSGVTNLLPSRRDLLCTRVVDSIMEGSNNIETDDYLTLDPRLSRGASAKTATAKTQRVTFQEAIVFVVGGGNYLEFQNLQDYAQRSSQKKITYGSTDIPTSKVFISQLEILGSK